MRVFNSAVPACSVADPRGRRRVWMPTLRWTPTVLLFPLLLAGCGGGGGDDVLGSGSVTPIADMAAGGETALSGSKIAGPIVPEVWASNPVPDAPAPFAAGVVVASLMVTAMSDETQTVNIAATLPAAGDPGLLLLLVPDGQSLSDPRIAAWVDAAVEEGVRLQAITDTQFLALGALASGYAGLILPDNLHTQASDELISAIRTYTQNNGRTMLVYDFGALLPNGFYPTTGGSRLADMAGVDYILYDALRDKTTGLGPVTALRHTMRQLLVPPGKSLAYVAPITSTTTALTTVTASSAPDSGLAKAAGLLTGSSLYLPVSTQDPGGVRGFDPQQYQQLRYAGVTDGPNLARPPPSVAIDFGRAFKSRSPVSATSVNLSAQEANLQAAAVAAADPVDAYNGYLLGNLFYPVYVTQGAFADGTQPGQRALAQSPDFGLVAGVNPVGTGQVLFVNLPLTYLKGRTDALPLHGFLHYFSQNLLNLAHLSAMPNGVAGMTLDWHLDAKNAQSATQSLMAKNVFNDPGALFSIEMTAGPDLTVAGDKLGWALTANTTAQKMLRTFRNSGHAVGSHGGWIHDYFGNLASDANQFNNTSGACRNAATGVDTFEQCLVLNRNAVDGVTGRKARSYSAPQGNNPLWAMTWLEQQGVSAVYFGGHTGLGVTRQYRDGQLLNPSLWVLPVTPQGLYATFEEFQDYQVPKAEVQQWYQDLIDFDISQNTSRMVYAHPPGADAWSDVLGNVLAYAKTKRSLGTFAWYSSLRLADFMTSRQRVTWSQATDAATGVTRFNAAHPVSLNELVWRLPKARYTQAPVVVSGSAAVGTGDALFWLVKARGGTSLVFTAKG